MRFLIALLSLLALTLVPTVAASAQASPTHASHCGEGAHHAKPDPVMSDCVAKCCTANPAATPAEPLAMSAPTDLPRPAYLADHANPRSAPPLPYEPPPPRTA
ncbi:MAG: hypothetical protein ABIR77_01440 [Sphingomicrobium sp.]